ncbi:MAG TPA: EVE domain-containing protein [Pirellulales bacterium]
MAKIQYWLFKTEPETYSFEQLRSDKKTHWNGVRNFQARNFLKLAKKGDQVVVYHSGNERAAVGVASIVKEQYEDPDAEFPPKTWVQVDIGFENAFLSPVRLSEIKANPTLKAMMLVKQSRLSCMPVTEAEFEEILRLGRKKPATPKGIKIKKK